VYKVVILMTGALAISVRVERPVNPALADHGAGLRSAGMSPLLEALIWAALAFLVGLAIVAIIGVLARRRTPRAPLILAALVLLPVAAEPHAALLKSSPGARASLRNPPARVELWFNERLEGAYSSVSVRDAAGAQVDMRDVTVGPTDPKRLSVSLPPLPAGSYTVRFRVLSVDGHVVESSFPFSVSDTRAGQ